MAKKKQSVPEWINAVAKAIKGESDSDGDVSEKTIVRIISEHAPLSRFVFTKDDDGHWYVIPADKQDEAAAYFDAVYNFWGGSSADENTTEPDRPEWLMDVGGAPSLVTFSSPEF